MKTRVAPEDKDPDRENEDLYMYLKNHDESAAVEPQGRVSDRPRPPQRKESPQRQKGKKPQPK